MKSSRVFVVKFVDGNKIFITEEIIRDRKIIKVASPNERTIAIYED